MANLPADHLNDHADDESSRRAGATDEAVGRRIRRVRLSQKLSLENLAANIGISCQQLQKYEAGANRIAVSRLIHIAKVLRVHATEFMSDAATAPAPADKPARLHRQFVVRLVNVLARLKNATSRSKILEMAEFLSSLEDEPPAPAREIAAR